MKHLVTSGCSFSDALIDGRWPQALGASIQEPVTLYNYGMGSKGNDWIAKSIIHKVSSLLDDGVAPGDIKVAAMWSGLDRKGLWISKDETHNFDKLRLQPGRCSSNPSDFSDPKFLQANRPRTDELYEADGRGYLAGSFPCTFNETINKWRNDYNKQFYTHEGAAIESYETFLRLQWFLEVNNIDHFFMTYANIMTWPQHMIHGENILTKDFFPSIQHLHKMINWDKWVFHNEIEGLYEYCVYHNLPLHSDDFHPEGESHFAYTKDIVYPAAQKYLHVL